jgi:nucleotide-binding universal stress UspA family protein
MFTHIMVPLDGSELAECVLPQVVSIATGCGVPLVSLVRVVPPLKIYTSELEGTFAIPDMQKIEDQSIANARQYLEKKASELEKQGVKPQVSVMFGNVIDSLTDFVEKNHVDLIIIATHGRSGISRFVWGSVADRILRTAKVPVLMVRPDACQLPPTA